MRNPCPKRALVVAVLLNLFSCAGVAAQELGTTGNVQRTTLFSRTRYKAQDYAKSAFNFQHGLRSDDKEWLRVTRNVAHLLYGSISLNHDSDWFSLSTVRDDPSRVKDLGEMEWSQVFYTPFLPDNPRQTEAIRFPGEGESFEASSDGRVTKAVLGHMYVARIKQGEKSLYVMFRVEALEPSDHCIISWKIMPSPEVF